MKERILNPVRPAIGAPLNDHGATPDVAPIERPAVAKLLRQVCTSTRPKIAIAPPGEGKTTAARAWARIHPHLIYIDVASEVTYAGAVTAVADAVGYSTVLTDDEQLARSKGYKIPSMDAANEGTLKDILALFKQACEELQAEGKLQPGFKPMLVLDHCNRPLTEQGLARQNVIRSLTVSGLDQPEPAQASPCTADTIIRAFLDPVLATTSFLFCLMTSDVEAEDNTIKSAACYDQRSFVRLEPFTRSEAETLLVRGIHALQLQRSQREKATRAAPSPPLVPTEDEANAIRRDYSVTIDFLLDAVGNRPGRLLSCLAVDGLLTDHELLAAGDTSVAARQMPADLKKLLPPELHDRSVAPDVAIALTRELQYFETAMRRMLEIPYTLRLPQTTPYPPTPDKRLADRVRRVDLLLRRLLEGPVSMDDAMGLFVQREAVLERLLAWHVLSLDGSSGSPIVQFDAPAVRHIARSILDSPQHKARVELLRCLLMRRSEVMALADGSSAEESARLAMGDAVELRQLSPETTPRWLWFVPKVGLRSASAEAQQTEAEIKAQLA